MIMIDVRNTYSALFLLSCGPRMRFQTAQERANGLAPEQDRSKDGLPKWEATLAVTYHSLPGARMQSETLSVTLLAASDPASSIPPGPVDVEGLRCGLSAPESGEGGRIRGGKLWYQADKIVPFDTSVNGSKSYGKSEVAA